jgi:transposase
LWFQLRFTPTSSSWLNSVECWFSAVTKRRIRLGSLVSAPDLMKAAT